MPTITATPGHASANSYGTLAEAETYMTTRLYITTWTAAVQATKEAALIWATRLIDANVVFTGSPSTDTQALAWPREDMESLNGVAIADDAIPQALKNAQFELALLLLSTDRTAENDVAAQGIVGVKAGPVDIRFKEGASLFRDAVPQSVVDLMFPSWVTRRDVPWIFTV